MLQPERLREPNPNAEDDAYDDWRQRRVDEETEREMKRRASGYSPEQLLAERAPKPQACHECGHAYVGAVCPICKEERPAYAALKKITRERTV